MVKFNKLEIKNSNLLNFFILIYYYQKEIYKNSYFKNFDNYFYIYAVSKIFNEQETPAGKSVFKSKSKIAGDEIFKSINLL